MKYTSANYVSYNIGIYTVGIFLELWFSSDVYFITNINEIYYFKIGIPNFGQFIWIIDYDVIIL